MVTVQVDGIAMVKANEAISAGAAVASDTAGEAIPAASGEARLGYAMQAATGAGEIISVLLKPAAADAA